MTSKEISKEFKDKLFALLREYDVEMSVEEDTSGYQSVVTGINFFSYTKYRGDGTIERESVDFTIGAWEDGKTIKR